MENKEMEIPFGANDSELIESTYHIPDGMEAIIEGDKVIIRKKEGEDERIRTLLISSVKNEAPIASEHNKELAIAWLKKQGEPNPYSGTSFKYDGHTWGMCARDYGVDIVLDKQLFKHLEKQETSYTKKDVDDAYLKGISDAKNELEKQYEANYQIRKDIATFIFNYRGDIKDRAKWMDYLGIKVSLVEGQGEQKPQRIVSAEAKEALYDKVD